LDVVFAALVLALAAAALWQWWAEPMPRPSTPAVSLQGRVVINEAPRSTLMLLPGIGPATADNIVDYRRAHGPFTEASQLEAVDQIGPVTRRKVSRWVRFTEPTDGGDEGIHLSRQGRPR
jgi:competence ComEA-like helix-hairpin-helix protein